MARGGKRSGAGRPAGVANKKTAERLAELEAGGLMPLDYMLSVLRNHGADPDDRKWAAEKAAPYCHAKLASIEHTGEGGKDLFPPTIAFVRDEG